MLIDELQDSYINVDKDANAEYSKPSQKEESHSKNSDKKLIDSRLSLIANIVEKQEPSIRRSDTSEVKIKRSLTDMIDSDDCDSQRNDFKNMGAQERK